MIVILIYIVFSQVLLQKDELWIERNSQNYQLSKGNYHIFRKYQIDGQVHHIQEYREKFSYYLFILTSQDNYYSIVSLKDPADDFRKQIIFKAQNQSCDNKFVITQYEIIWRCHTTKDIFFFYNLQTKLYKVNKLGDVSVNYFIFQFTKLIRYTDNTLRVYNIKENQLLFEQQYTSNFTIEEHFDDQQNAIMFSKTNMYIVWYKVEDIIQTNKLDIFEYTQLDFITDEELEFFYHSNIYYLISLYQKRQKGQSISWQINYQAEHPRHLSICQIYNRNDQNILVYDLRNYLITKTIQINSSALPFINLYTQDLYLFHNQELQILVEIDYKNYKQTNYPSLLINNSIKEIKNSRYIYQIVQQFNFIHLNQKGQFPQTQIYIGGDITYKYQQLDQFDKIMINFETEYFLSTFQYQCIHGIQIQNKYPQNFFICQQQNYSFTIYFIDDSVQSQYYYYDDMINFEDYLFQKELDYLQEQQMFIAVKYQQVLYVYKLNKLEKAFIIKFNFDEIFFYKQYAFLSLNGNVLKYNIFLNNMEFLESHLLGYKIQIDNNFYCYKDQNLLIGNYVNGTFVVYQNQNLNNHILRMFIFKHTIILISQNQIQKFEKINTNRIVLIGDIELYGNIINENSSFVSDYHNQFLYIKNEKKLLVINTQLSLSQALVISFEMESQQQLLFVGKERICFRADTVVQCSKIEPRIQYKIDFYSIEKYYQIQIQLESSNKYDTQRYNQVIEIFQSYIPMKIIHNKTVTLNAYIDLGKEWYQGSLIKLFSNNYELLRQIREKRYITNITQLIHYQQQEGDQFIFYSNYRKILLYNIKDNFSQQIKHPQYCDQAILFKEYILYQCPSSEIWIYQCAQFQNCQLAKTIQMNEQFHFNYDELKYYISIKFVSKGIVAAYKLENLSLEKVFEFRQSLQYDYFYNVIEKIVINFENSSLTINNNEKVMTFNDAFKHFNQSNMEKVQKIKILNENHFLVSFQRQGIFIYHFEKELSVKYNLFPHKIMHRSVTNVIQIGNEYSFGIQTQDNFILIYKLVLDNIQFSTVKVIEAEFYLELDYNIYINHFQLFYYEQEYYIAIQDSKHDSLIIFQINFNNIIRVDEYQAYSKFKIRLSDLEKFEIMELTIYEEQNYIDIFILILPIMYLVLRIRQLKYKQN